MSQFKRLMLIVLLSQTVACGQKGALLSPVSEKTPTDKTDLLTQQPTVEATLEKQEIIQ